MEQYPAVSVHNLHHNAVPTAELAFTLLLSVAKQVLPFDAALRENDWQLRYEPSQTWLMKGKTALILGYGEIGSRVGRYLDALGMRVRATRKHPPDPPTGSVEVYSAGQLEALLPEADVLVVTLPLTPETRGLVGEKELAQLPAGAILVNVARGPVVDQGALYSALKTGQLFGAGLDVWYHYPHAEEERSDTSPADDPFHELPNVVMSPHRGGSTRETEQLRMEYLAALLQAAAEGRSIPNQVDFDRGY
jgi:phosphoglycerate dehydrogenase-like enzyme